MLNDDDFYNENYSEQFIKILQDNDLYGVA